MFKAVSLRSWNLNTPDLEATVRFYRDVLGAEEGSRQTIGGGAVARLRLGDQGIGLFDAAAGDRPGVPHHTFAGEGPATADELIKALESRGIAVDGVRMHGSGPGYSVYVNDPAGNRLELSVDPA
jgi:catechol 2,3-dioxygenase-like lactoylglutathione lyase family enzyme